MQKRDPGGRRTRAHGGAVFAHRSRAHLSAAVWRPHDRLRRRRPGAARLRRRRPHRARDHPYALSAVPQKQCAVLCRVFRARSDCRRRGRLPRGDGLEPRRRDPAPVQRASRDPRHRRLRPGLLLLHLGAHLHRRRQRDGLARRVAAAGHGIRPVPPDRHLRRRLSDYRGGARRGRLSDQQRGRALHGSLRAARQGSGVARRRQPVDDDRDPRRARLRPAEGPHSAAPRTYPARGVASAVAGHHRDGAHLCRESM